MGWVRDARIGGRRDMMMMRLPWGAVAAAVTGAGLVLGPLWRQPDATLVAGAGAAALLGACAALACARVRAGWALVVAAGAWALSREPLLGAAVLAGGRIDAAAALRRAFAAVMAPLLRATATTRAAELPAAHALAELLGARALLLLWAGPGARRVRPGASHRLALREGAPLDPRRPPYRDGHGVARVGDASRLVDEPTARLLPLADGAVEGFVVFVPDPAAPSLEETPRAALAIARDLARLMRAERLRARRPSSTLDPVHASATALTVAAVAADRRVATLEAAVGRAATGLCLLTASGATLWKNDRFDELAAVARGRGDLARVLELVSRPGEAPAAALERLLAGPERAACLPGLVASVSPAGEDGALLVELEIADAACAAALAPPRLQAVD
jgi:hypothetical protein